MSKPLQGVTFRGDIVDNAMSIPRRPNWSTCEGYHVSLSPFAVQVMRVVKAGGSTASSLEPWDVANAEEVASGDFREALGVEDWLRSLGATVEGVRR